MNITDVDSMNNHTGFANNINSTLSSSNDLTFTAITEHPYLLWKFYYIYNITFMYSIYYIYS